MTELAGHLLGHRLPGGPRGESWVGRDRRTGRQAVVRHIEGRSDAAPRLRHDLQLLASATRGRSRLTTDVTVVDADVVLVSPWIGRSLAELHAQGERRDPDAVVADLAAMADELAAMHARAVVHGSLTPPNVLLDDTDRALLADFGVAAALGDHRGGRDPLDDVAALGAIALSMLTAQPAPPPEVDALDVAISCPAGLGALLDAARRRRLDAAGLAERAALLRTDPRSQRDGDGFPVPVAPSVASPSTARRAPLVGVIAAVAVVAAGFATARSPGPSTGSPTPATIDLPPCAAEPPSVDGDEVIAWGDLDGRGCLDAVVWSPSRAEARVASGAAAGRYALGRPGDVLALGDWDGDGRASPSLYRPDTGEVFRWDTWAAGGSSLASAAGAPSGVIGGRPVVVDDGAAHALVVSPDR